MSKDKEQDTITFQLRADTYVVSDTVKISVRINAAVPQNSTESELRIGFKEAMTKFIPADWKYHGMARSVDATGFEQVTLIASARVSETENYNLQGRADKVSRVGLKLTITSVDNSVPQHMLENAEKELRAKILQDAKNECEEIKKLTERKFRVSSVNFNNSGDAYTRKTPMTASYASVSSFEATGGAGDDSLANAQKVSLDAEIQLSV